jgi:hypothetical protein
MLCITFRLTRVQAQPAAGVGARHSARCMGQWRRWHLALRGSSGRLSQRHALVTHSGG